MPLYEYQCKQCGHRFERIQSFSAEPVKVCPVCGGEVEKLISASAVLFKGSGFYSTDYGAKPSAKAKQDSGDGSAAPAASDGKSSSSEKNSGAQSAPAKTDSAASAAPATKPAG